MQTLPCMFALIACVYICVAATLGVCLAERPFVLCNILSFVSDLDANVMRQLWA